ncbi:hypothetical protein PAMP_008403 [Pampus punctatissimus]
MSLPLQKESPQQICRGRHHMWRAQEAGNAVRHAHTQKYTPADLRLRGSVVVVTVAVVVLLQLRANTHTLKTAEQTPPDRWNVNISLVCVCGFYHMPT